jgi:outer membrane protein assembly factor BamB
VNNEFWGINPDGTKKWTFGYPIIDGAAALAADGTIYFGGDSGILYAWNRNGQVKLYTTVGWPFGSPAIAADGTVYVGSREIKAYKTDSGLDKSSWPKFRGNAAQTGRINAN